MRLSLIAISFAALLGSHSAHSAVFKCTSSDGSVTYTNDPSSARNCERLRSDLPVSTVPSATPQRPATANRPATPAPAASPSFPRVTPEAQQSRDNTRRQLLQQELATEQQALDQARKTLTEEENRVAPEDRVIRQMPDGSSRAIINQGRVEQRLQTHRDQIELHERNIRALEQELQRLR